MTQKSWSRQAMVVGGTAVVTSVGLFVGVVVGVGTVVAEQTPQSWLKIKS